MSKNAVSMELSTPMKLHNFFVTKRFLNEENSGF